MKACPSCEQNNADEANFCARCGTALAENTAPFSSKTAFGVTDEQQYIKGFIGPSKSVQFSLKEGWSWKPAYLYYLEKFRLFQTSAGPKFALTWHWPAALFDPFLWFLYRKLYLYALLYAVGPVLSVFITGDMTVGVVWRILAGASANYIYFWHVKDHLQKIRSRAKLDPNLQMRLVKDAGGIQPYVLWLGIALHLFMVGLIIAAIQQGTFEGPPFDPDVAK
jgi:hypothetical protein